MIAEGTCVRVRDCWPEAEGPVHCRTPHYVRGRRGRVVRGLGAFPDPGEVAFARQAPLLRLYHVAFPLGELWPEGSGDDELLVEIYEPWLAVEGA